MSMVSAAAGTTWKEAGPSGSAGSISILATASCGEPPPFQQASAASTGHNAERQIASRFTGDSERSRKDHFMNRLLIAALAVPLALACGRPRTSGFFVGPTIGAQTSHDTSAQPVTVLSAEFTDTLLNCTFDNVIEMPFGDNCRFETYHGALHIDNYGSAEPIVLLSTAGLQKDATVEADFDLVDTPPQAVVGLVLRAQDASNFLLAGVNSRGQYTVQQCLNGMWIPVMGLEPFESSRLLPFDQGSMLLTAEVHGSYVDFSVNGQLIQVIRTAVPPAGQIGIFVDAYSDVALDRLTVVPSE
jgi:hypothetical protein